MSDQFPRLPELNEHFSTMNNLSIMICRMLGEQHGLAYAESKVEHLKLMSSSEAFFWATHALDSQNQSKLAEALGMGMSDFQAAGRALKIVHNM